MTHISRDALVMVGDGARALFFRNSGTPLQPKLTVEKVFEQDNPPTREQGTDRPTRGSDFSGGWATNVGSPRSNIEQTDWHQLNEDRFAKDIADKLYQLAHANRFQRLVIVAPPKVLGTLRKAMHKEVLERVEAEVAKDLAHAPITAIQDELAKGESS
jgi:protein required for attachment to host cells